MKKSNGLVLIIGGVIALIVSIVLPIIEMSNNKAYLERTGYHSLAPNYTGIAVVSLIAVAGVMAIIIGTKKMKSSK